MASIKTITLNGSETEVKLFGQSCDIRNDGSDTLYASRKPGIIAGADGVMSIPAGSSAKLLDCCGKLYLLGTGSALCVGSDLDKPVV